MTQATLTSWLRVETFENIAGWQMTVRDLDTGRAVSTRGEPHESKAVALQVLSDALRIMRSGGVAAFPGKIAVPTTCPVCSRVRGEGHAEWCWLADAHPGQPMAPTREQLEALIAKWRERTRAPIPAESVAWLTAADELAACLAAPPPEPQALIASAPDMRDELDQIGQILARDMVNARPGEPLPEPRQPLHPMARLVYGMVQELRRYRAAQEPPR